MTSLLAELPTTATAAQWPVWSTVVRVVVTDASALAEARALVAAQLQAVDEAANRFRPDSEVSLLAATGGRPARVSPVLAELLAAALLAARDTDGDLDPTLGAAMVALGYDRDLPLLARPGRPAAGRFPAATVRRVPGWRSVQLSGDVVTVPAGVLLDLGATAKAWAADRSAATVATRLGVGALVSLGGDLATAGRAPDGGWQVLVSDQPGDPRCTVALPAGAALATSSTVSRRWRSGGRMMHHVVDPRTCRPAPGFWRTVSVIASGCVTANALSTGTIVRGAGGLARLRRLGAPARLVTEHRGVLTVNGWPAESAS